MVKGEGGYLCATHASHAICTLTDGTLFNMHRKVPDVSTQVLFGYILAEILVPE